MNTLIAGLLALLTLGGSAAMVADCTDLAGQGHVCTDTSNGVTVDVLVEPQLPPVAAAMAAPTCTDVAGQATLCHEIAADPASGVYADVDVEVHPTPPVRASGAEPTCQDLAGHGFVCAEADPASGVSVDFEVTV